MKTRSVACSCGDKNWYRSKSGEVYKYITFIQVARELISTNNVCDIVENRNFEEKTI